MGKSAGNLNDLPLRRKTIIAFCLISLLPLLVCVFLLVSGPVPVLAKLFLGAVIGVIILLGWRIITQVLGSISHILNKTYKSIDVSGQIPDTRDEIKILDKVFDNITSTIKKNSQKLKEISRDTELINRELTKRVSLFSAIIQINDLASGGLGIKQVFKFASTRLRDSLNLDICFIIISDTRDVFVSEFTDESQKINQEALSKAEPFLRSIVESRELVVLDMSHTFSIELEDFIKEALRTSSIILAPIMLNRKILGVLGATRKGAGFSYSQDEQETVKIFARHIGLLLKREETGSTIQDQEKDLLTGLYSSRFIKERLSKELEKANSNQRPCGLLLIKIKDIKRYIDKHGIIMLEKACKNIADIITNNLDASEEAGRLSEDKVVIIAPEKSKAQLQQRAEFLLSQVKFNLSKQGIDLDLHFSMAENPLDGLTQDELINKAEGSLL